MIRLAFIAAALLFVGIDAQAADTCQDLVTNKQLPKDFKVLSRSAVGPAELVILSNGTCTCNDTPAVQRSLGQPEPDGVFWACEKTDAGEAKGE